MKISIQSIEVQGYAVSITDTHIIITPQSTGDLTSEVADFVSSYPMHEAFADTLTKSFSKEITNACITEVLTKASTLRE